MKIQSLKIEIPNNAENGATLANVNRVYEYLLSRGWNVTRPSVNRHARKGLIQRNEAGEFPLAGVLEYAAQHWQITDPALAVAEEPEQTARESLPDVILEAGLEPGIAHALARLRNAEAQTYQAWQNSLAAGKPATTIFRSYTQAVEALRKFERSILDLQREQKELLPKTTIKKWMFGQIVSAKATLTNLPGKLAPQLEGLKWPEIQRKLEEEIGYALDKLSSDPCADLEGGMEATSPATLLEMGREQS